MSPIAPLAYSLEDFAEACGVSLSTIKNEINDGNLTKSYIRGKPVITAAEADRYMASLPSEAA